MITHLIFCVLVGAAALVGVAVVLVLIVAADVALTFSIDRFAHTLAATTTLLVVGILGQLILLLFSH